MSPAYTLEQIAGIVDGKVRGDAQREITGVASIHDAAPGEITWVQHAHMATQLAQCQAGAVLVAAEFGETPMPAVVCADVERAVTRVLGLFAPVAAAPPPGIDAAAVVSPHAIMGDNVSVGPFAVIEAGARVGNNTVLSSGVHLGPESRVGDDCRLWSHVVVRERCVLGDRVTIHANSVIGADGFGYIYRDGVQVKIPHLGNVVVQDDVEIGACTCIDRAKVGSTVVGAGTKIDNLVQVAHNVVIGANSILCAQTGVAGSAKLGNLVVLGGQAGIRDNIVLNDGVMVGACSCVPQDVPAGKRVAGVPAIEVREFLRQTTAVSKLPGLISKLRDLTKRLERLEAATDHLTHSRD